MPYQCLEPFAHVELRCTYHSSSHHYVSRPNKMPGYCTYRYAFISAKTPYNHHILIVKFKHSLCEIICARARARVDFICATPHVSVCVRALRRSKLDFIGAGAFCVRGKDAFAIMGVTFTRTRG